MLLNLGGRERGTAAAGTKLLFVSELAEAPPPLWTSPTKERKDASGGAPAYLMLSKNLLWHSSRSVLGRQCLPGHGSHFAVSFLCRLVLKWGIIAPLGKE